MFRARIAGSDLQVTRSGDDVVIALKNADGTLSGDQILIEKGLRTGTIRSKLELPMVQRGRMTSLSQY